MKKIFLPLLILPLILFFPGIVKADVIYTVDDFNLSEYETAINTAYDYINNNNYNYYVISLSRLSDSNDLALYLRVFNEPISSQKLTVSTTISIEYSTEITAIDINKDGTYTNTGIYSSAFDYIYSNSFYRLYDTNISIINNIGFSLVFDGLFGTTVTIDNNQEFPTLKNGLPPSELIEVNLNDYAYVLLNLKDYSKTEAFSSNLQVKGMIGITPIYNYGTTEKDNPGDRCNLSYSDYTDYRLYVLKSDLENKAIYRVSSCEDNSSFKFDNTVFDITYVTDDNIDDPVVTIDGQDYHVLTDLSWTAEENEENNVIPGESNQLTLSEIVDNVTDTLSSVWNSLTTFMSLITRFFNSLPVEFRIVCVTTFTTICVLGIIKVIKS